MILENNFKQITQLFYSAQYELGNQQISTLINENPNLSILYANRALFLSQMGKEQAATHDLKRAIKLNPINYIAYFNLFSIQTSNNYDEEAFSNLCCSLSIMYLIKAKLTKNIEYARKSLTFANNNLQARILCGLIYLETCQYEKAKEQFIAALKLYPRKTLLYRLLGQVSKKIDPQFDDSDLKGMYDKDEQLISNPLRGSLVLPPNADLIQEINKRVDEFDQLYNEINNQFLGVTEKVPQQPSIVNKIDAFILDKSKCSKSNHESVIAILQDEQYFTSKQQNCELKHNFQKLTSQNDGDGVESTVTAVHSTHGIEIIQEDDQLGDISNEQMSESNNQITNHQPLQ